jgi:hypothetical protein
MMVQGYVVRLRLILHTLLLERERRYDEFSGHGERRRERIVEIFS